MKVLRTIAQSWRYGCKTIVKAAEDGGLKTFTAVTSILNTKITREQVGTLDASSNQLAKGDG